MGSRAVPIKDENARQAAFLAAFEDEPHSGRVRYAAAMYFYQHGLLSEDSLEVYRTCSVIDHEDPRPVLAGLGLALEIEAIAQLFKSIPSAATSPSTGTRTTHDPVEKMTKEQLP